MRIVIAALIALSASTAVAQEGSIRSVYTSFDSKSCRHQPGTEEEDYGSWTCRGLNGIGIRLSAGDQRMYVSYGKATETEDLAATQTLPGFNDVYKGTVEWRVETKGRKQVPFATILRWNVMTEKDQENARGPTAASGRVLVVTRLNPGGVCHVGYVDARANPNANDTARKIADERARAFRCGSDEAAHDGTVEGAKKSN
jgi:hypothetical protein